ncbi:hypothetical protein BDU57DRAFT_521259 [Ampelomyces quisqualis]|uniref:Uncharacterized protein n=1 Tax=Ampelomyces quisqualis TaxID=50730 RepID=A0A6A5QF45_AMPQU|nr:hypothetical protein BDU57DRAFT_521259 [Ampelomyces quisqualis]
MQPRFSAFAAAFKRLPPFAKTPRPYVQTRISQLICRTCRQKFSTSPSRRLAGGASREQTAKSRMYSSRLLIYEAGDARLTWITFWKAVALLQCGTTLVFAVPPLWKNEIQPDPNLRKAQALLVGVLGTIPTLTLAYLTAPFVYQVFLQIPEHARRSRQDLMRFVTLLNAKPAATADTKLEFVTLRIFPFRKNTSNFLHELRALPPKKMRLANIEFPKSEEWAKRQREKGIFRRILEVISEPRYKFYVKEGRTYTIKTGVPGVWEEVAKRIQIQTDAERDDSQPAHGMQRTIVRKPVQRTILQEKIKRQTARTPKQLN